MYGGAEGHGFRWDTGGFHDYGVIVEGESYVRSVACGDGKLYWGIGAHPHLIEMDARTGQRREIALPADLSQPPNSFVYDLTFTAGLLFARFESSRTTLIVIDPRTRTVVDRINDTYGRIDVGGYFSGGLGIFDPVIGELHEQRDVGQIESFTSYAGRIYLGIYPEAKLLSYDPGQPWAYGTNPVELLQLHEQGQTRPLAMTPVGDRIARLTEPDAAA